MADQHVDIVLPYQKRSPKAGRWLTESENLSSVPGIHMVEGKNPKIHTHTLLNAQSLHIQPYAARLCKGT